MRKFTEFSARLRSLFLFVFLVRPICRLGVDGRCITKSRTTREQRHLLTDVWAVFLHPVIQGSDRGRSRQELLRLPLVQVQQATVYGSNLQDVACNLGLELVQVGKENPLRDQHRALVHQAVLTTEDELLAPANPELTALGTVEAAVGDAVNLVVDVSLLGFGLDDCLFGGVQDFLLTGFQL
jgi:hypothetical protein